MYEWTVCGRPSVGIVRQRSDSSVQRHQQHAQIKARLRPQFSILSDAEFLLRSR